MKKTLEKWLRKFDVWAEMLLTDLTRKLSNRRKNRWQKPRRKSRGTVQIKRIIK